MKSTSILSDRELDILIAEKVMGWKGEGHKPCVSEDSCHRNETRMDVMTVPPYSTDIAAAWEIVRKIREERASIRSAFTEALRQFVSYRMSGEAKVHGSDLILYVDAIDICFAAIKAVNAIP